MSSEVVQRLAESNSDDEFLNIFSRLKTSHHTEAALSLIEKGRGDLVIHHISSFKGLDYADIANNIIERGRHCIELARHLSDFAGVDQRDIARKLMTSGESAAVIENLFSFKDISHTEIVHAFLDGSHALSDLCVKNLSRFRGLDETVAHRLMDMGYIESFVRNLSRFNGLDYEALAGKLIAEGESDLLAGNLSKFKGLSHAQIANDIIEDGKPRAVAEHLDNFVGLDHAAIANSLTRNGHILDVVRNLSRFEDVDHGTLAGRLLAEGRGKDLAAHLSQFKGLDHIDIANNLIENGEHSAVMEYIANFEDSNHVAIAHRLIEEGYGEGVARYISSFRGVDHTDIATKIIERGQGGADAVTKHLAHFKNLDGSVGCSILEMVDGGGYEVIGNLPSFKPDHTKIAHKLLDGSKTDVIMCVNNLFWFKKLDGTVADKLTDKGHGSAVIRNLSRFEGFDHDALADKLIEEGNGELLVNNLSEFKGLDYTDIANKLIESGKAYIVVEHLTSFKGLNHVVLADRLIAEGSGDAVAIYLSSFKGLDHADIANRLIESGRGHSVAKYLLDFKGIDYEDIAYKLIENERSDALAENIYNFRGINLSEDIAFHLIKQKRGSDVAFYLYLFKGIDHGAVADALIKNNGGYALAEHLSNFKGIDHGDIARRLIEKGEAYVVAEHLSSFTGVNHTEIAHAIIDDGLPNAVSTHLSEFKGLNKTVAYKLIRAGDGLAVAHSLDRFDNLDHTDIANRLIETSGGVDTIAINLERFNGLDSTIAYKIIERKEGGGHDIVDNLSSFESLDHTKLAHTLIQNGYAESVVEHFFTFKGLDGTVADSLKEQLPERFRKRLGLTEKGQEGLKQIREGVQNIKREFLYDGVVPEKGVHSRFFKEYARYKVSEWGYHDHDAFRKLIDAYDPDNHWPLNDSYTPSEDLGIRLSRQKENVPFTEDFKEKFDTLRSAVTEAWETVQKQKKPLSVIVQRIDLILDEVILRENREKYEEAVREHDALTDPKKKKGNEFKLKNLKKKIDDIEQMNVRSIAEFRDNLTALLRLQDKELNHEIMVLFFAFSFLKNRNFIDQSWETVHQWDEGKEPTREDIIASMNFISHVTYHETLEPYLKGNKAGDLFHKLINTSSFEDQLKRIQENEEEAQKTTTIRCVPTRNLLTEFSGHIADACWANKYDSILQEFPNITSLMFVQHPDTPNERLAGSCLLLETETQDGKRILIIRGLNPIENVINQVSEDSFYTQVTEYVKEIAEKDGRIATIAIDDHSGGYGTNRPSLHAYLSKKKADLRLLPLGADAAGETTFNDYNLEGGIYVV